jgi:hypothetical protein
MLRSRSLLRLALLAAVLGGVAACEPTNQGYQPEQPVAYSHAVHAGGQEIPCTYCHYGAERGRYAGIPAASVCMNCHTQIQPDNPEIVKVVQAIDQRDPIEWYRVHKLPDHAFFDHSAHVVAGGLECQDCHGPVEAMGLVRQEEPLTMGWCLDCHRQQDLPASDPSPEAPPGLVPAVGANLEDCSTCHR